MNNLVEIAGAFLALIVPIGGFIYWHFKAVNEFKDEIHRQDLRIKELESTDKNQQQTIDQLKDLFPVLNEAMKIISEKKKR